MKDTAPAQSDIGRRNPHSRLDRFVDRIAAWLWGRKPRRGVLFVFTQGRGDLTLLSHVVERFRPLLEPDERADILLREPVRPTAFVLPGWLHVSALPSARFQSHATTRLLWSLRLARRRYRRAIVFNPTWSPLRDERLARVATGGRPDFAISVPGMHPALDAMRERYGRGRYFVNNRHRHTLLFWADFASHLTGVPPAPVVPRLPVERLAPARRGARPHVLLHPFPSYPAKYFGPEAYAPLIEALAASHDVLVSTGPLDREKYPEMRSLARYPHLRFTGAGLEEIAGMVRGADIVVSVDTALAHLGIACAAPTLVLHNTADVGVYMPYPEEIRPADARFLPIPPRDGARRGRWQPKRAWPTPPDTGVQVRDAALTLLAEVGAGRAIADCAPSPHR